MSRSTDDPIGFYGGWKAYFVATYALAGVAVLCGVSRWVLWLAPLTVPIYLLLTFPLWDFSLLGLLLWMLFAGVVVVAVHGAGGILEHWRTPRQALRSSVLFFAAIAVELWLLRRD